MLSRRKDFVYSSREGNCSDFPPGCERRAKQRHLDLEMCPPRMTFGGKQFPQHLSVQAVPADRLSSWMFLEDKKWRVWCFTCLIQSCCLL